MSLIDPTYMIGEIILPDGVNSKLDSIIARYEPEILKKLLGYELWEAVDDDPADPQLIKDLVEGKDYTVDYNGRDQVVRWNGFVNEDKKSVIAYYVYYWAKLNSVSQNANVGTVIPKQSHSVPFVNTVDVSTAWHRMRELYGYYGQDALAPSVFNFLTKFKDDYPEWVFSEIGIINFLGT